MWNPFRRKKEIEHGQKSPGAETHPNRLDELTDVLQREGRVAELEQELMKLDRSTLSATEEETWWQLYGIAAFREDRDDEALERFEEGYRRFPDSAPIRFSLGQQYIRTRAIDKGFDLFRTCTFPDVSAEYVLAQARYAYLWNRYDDGLSFIRPFFKAYRELKILDDNFLYIRGLPFFGRWWSYLAAFTILAGKSEELETVTRFVVEHCTDYDFDFLQVELEAYRDDNPARLLSALEEGIASVPSGDFPTGHTRLLIAVLKARAATTLAAARDILGSVALSGQDFPWLADVRTLALAEAARRFGDAGSEEKQAEAFLIRQPLLFEPDIALNFHLLRYQERLKPRVTAQ